MSVKVHRQDCNTSPANHACIYLKINEVRLTNDNNNAYCTCLQNTIISCVPMISIAMSIFLDFHT